MRCNLCPKACRVNRTDTLGRCGAGQPPLVARAMVHRYEEPCISGTAGSGAVFFSGCNLGCVFCQNAVLQGGQTGRPYSAEALCELFASLAAQGVHNINLVTPTPHIPTLRRALRLAKEGGLAIPVVYNTGSYERVSALRALAGLVDIYLPDFKYVSPVLSARFSGAPDYFAFAGAAVDEMYRQAGPLVTDANGLAVSGVLIRHLVLPGCVDDSRRVLDHLAERYGTDAALSLMRQYTPTPQVTAPPLNRVLTGREYDRVLLYALSLGFHNIWMQHKESANSAFTPSFTDYQ